MTFVWPDDGARCFLIFVLGCFRIGEVLLLILWFTYLRKIWEVGYSNSFWRACSTTRDIRIKDSFTLSELHTTAAKDQRGILHLSYDQETCCTMWPYSGLHEADVKLRKIKQNKRETRSEPAECPVLCEWQMTLTSCRQKESAHVTVWGGSWKPLLCAAELRIS